jgi:hypothetical protein
VNCVIEGCQKKAIARNWCWTHYQRWADHGDPAYTRTWEQRFWSKVDKSGECWVWTGAINNYGYGVIGKERRTLTAHRVAYELLVGPIPGGLTIDHLCHASASTPCVGLSHKCPHRRCVNPEHLEPVSPGENARRKPKVIFCKHGHLFDERNTYELHGKRSCRKCATNRRLERKLQLVWETRKRIC